MSSTAMKAKTTTTSLTHLPDDLLYAIIAPVFSSYVLRAFDASYPRTNKHEIARPFVEEMTDNLMFTGIFSLLHVSWKFREITGRLLLRVVPSHSSNNDTPEEEAYIKAISRLECSALLCISIARNTSIIPILESNFYHELVLRTHGHDLIHTPLVQTYGFINRLRAYLNSLGLFNIRRPLPNCPVSIKVTASENGKRLGSSLKLEGWTLERVLPSYYHHVGKQAFQLHREILVLISLIDMLQIWDKGFERGITSHALLDPVMENDIKDFSTRVRLRLESSRSFARAVGRPSLAVHPEPIIASVPRQLEITYKMQVILLWNHFQPGARAQPLDDFAQSWMMKLAFGVCDAFDCAFRSMDSNVELLSKNIDFSGFMRKP